MFFSFELNKKPCGFVSKVSLSLCVAQAQLTGSSLPFQKDACFVLTAS
jgi:hypothetical protein